MEINGVNYVLKYSLRSMFTFEEITGKPFSISTLLDTYCFCYSCIISNPDNQELDFNSFIDWCDEHPETIDEFHKFMDGEIKKRELLGGTKKKVTKKKQN